MSDNRTGNNVRCVHGNNLSYTINNDLGVFSHCNQKFLNNTKKEMRLQLLQFFPSGMCRMKFQLLYA